ncbi:phosphoglycerate kinase [Microgenomates group bacterium RIFCSPLOWO2_01_FULL_47_10]|nr:MAG: phosphoglycerate kinase [Microgenomates group bacterium RIFCSPLOWO2_01_FULL_47_10]
MKLKSIKDIDVSGKKILLKVDYNVPLSKNSKGQMQIMDDTRIQISLPTIRYLLSKNCAVILMSHVGRPDGEILEDCRMKPMANHLAHLLNQPVSTVNEVIGDQAAGAAKNLLPGGLLMLENNRFAKGETGNDLTLAKTLASYADIFVNDGFSLSHRAHASVEGVTHFLPSYAGLALIKEVEMLSKLTDHPQHPFVAVVGGAKISDKVDAIKNLRKVADVILVGGGVANNFLKAEGVEVFHSYLQDVVADETKKSVDYIEFSKKLMDDAKQGKMLLDGFIPLPQIIYPVDVYSVTKLKKTDSIHLVNVTKEVIQEKQANMYIDIGPKTQKLYSHIISQAKTIFWNGPMGIFEIKEYAAGTKAVANAIAGANATTILGGGDTINAIHQFGLDAEYDYVSTSGGASLEFLGGLELPGLKPLTL